MIYHLKNIGEYWDHLQNRKMLILDPTSKDSGLIDRWCGLSTGELCVSFFFFFFLMLPGDSKVRKDKGPLMQ